MSKHKKNIVITGFMGTGKSTVAPLVAKILNRKHIDTDSLLETQFGKSIAKVFEEEGECTFRAAERKLLEELSKENSLVISTGGGSLLHEDTLGFFRENASVFCLNASSERIFERLATTNDRPLLASAKSEDKEALVSKLLVSRRQAYRRIFHQIDTSKKSPEDVCTQIIERFEGDQIFRTPSSQMVEIPGERPYPISIQSGLLTRFSAFLGWLGFANQKIAIVANHNLWHLYGMLLAKHLEASGYEVVHCTLHDGESFKTLESVQHLYEQFLGFGLNRSSLVVSLGGGVTGDVAGFAASTFMRGVDFVQVPTTLLAMVDASVGGKTGVDLPQGKNLVGTFKQPIAVAIDPDTLKSLAIGEFRSGMAEVLKHAIIADAQLFKQIEEVDYDDLPQMLKRALRVKIDIVEADPFEENIRAYLNLGHTFAHAIELCKNYTIRHGEAVALGLVAAAKLGELLQKNDGTLTTKIESVIASLRLPTRIKDIPARDIFVAMQHDKKRGAEGLRLIVSLDIGRIEICQGVAESVIMNAIEHICQK